MFKYTGEKKFLGRSVLAAAALVGLLGSAATPRAYADDNHCQKRISKADHKLHEAIEHHGGKSRRAGPARPEIRGGRESCWELNHRWGEEDRHRWHNERDSADHDHDRHQALRGPKRR